VMYWTSQVLLETAGRSLRHSCRTLTKGPGCGAAHKAARSARSQQQYCTLSQLTTFNTSMVHRSGPHSSIVRT
jgi:hypothetical protein